MTLIDFDFRRMYYISIQITEWRQHHDFLSYRLFRRHWLFYDRKMVYDDRSCRMDSTFLGTFLGVTMGLQPLGLAPDDLVMDEMDYADVETFDYSAFGEDF